jgi:hypothetical protein
LVEKNKIDSIQNKLILFHQTLPSDVPPLKPEITLRTHELEIEESAGGWRHTAQLLQGALKLNPHGLPMDRRCT